MSLPTRERGLKHGTCLLVAHLQTSLPTRERGLKRQARIAARSRLAVAPHAGAWIETGYVSENAIEIATSLPTRERGLKHSVSMRFSGLFWSLPTRERGLKRFLAARG